MKAIITVTGKDTVGIIAKVSACCSDYNANILDITQKVLGDMFVMIMMADITGLNIKFTDFVDKMDEIGKGMGLSIRVQREDIFQAMHRI